MSGYRHIVAAIATVLVLAAWEGEARESRVSESSVGAAYVEAEREIRNGNYREAVKLLEVVLEGQPRNADALNNMGFSQRKLGNFEQAFAFYHQALAVEPDHPEAHEYLGEAYLETDDPAMAEQHLAKLETICGTGCEEYQELKAAIDAFRAGTRSSRTW